MTDHARKTAIVTGASKGMGSHFVAALTDAGWNVVALARPSAELDALAADRSGHILALACDVSSPDQVQQAVDQAIGQFGRLDLIVNNAAIFQPFLLEAATDAEVHQHVSVNILGVVWLIRAAIPHLRTTGGQIVSISSESVRHPFPMLSLYAATKAAVETLSAGLREELKSEGIRVSVLRSGSVAGGSGGAAWKPENTQAFYKKIVETGHASMAGEAAMPESMAKALLAIVSLPADVNADLIEVRAARVGVPEGARQG